jgi:hypothetical protein
VSFKYNDILKIPERNLVEQRLTKAFFSRAGVLTSAEKKLLNNHILHMEILAQLIPDNSNIPAVVTQTDSFEQVLVVVCTVNDNQLDKVADKCVQLIQKYLAHQVILIVEDSMGFRVNAAEKRINQNDKSKLTIERHYTTGTLSKLYRTEVDKGFYQAIDFNTLNKLNLQVLYKGYVKAVVQYQAANITGSYIKRDGVRTDEDMQRIASIEQLQQEISTLSKQIKKESQPSEQVRLNITIHQKRQEIDSLKKELS